ncbi:MAG: hypothetical protein QM796_05085 [Chthoniobacteraceae bacterium]
MRLRDLGSSSALWMLVTFVMSMAGRPAQAQQPAAPDYNATILYQIAEMPSGGDYMAGGTAMTKLQNAVSAEGPKLTVNPQAAMPSFCSSATYLVFLKAVAALQEQGGLRLSDDAVKSLAQIANMPDGRGAWGRWNANGPGTARLFRELGLGTNFTDYAKAPAGGFHENLLVGRSGKAGARPLGDFSR